MPTVHHSQTALAYARSLVELAQERNVLDETAADMRGVAEVIEQNPQFLQLLQNPGISGDERSRVFTAAFSGASPLVRNFLGYLNARGQAGMLGEILAAFEDVLDELLGKVEVDVTVAQRLDAGDLETVRQRVSSALGKDAVVHQYVDDSIIGGLIIRVGDRLIDASVRRQLQDMKQRLLSSRQSR